MGPCTFPSKAHAALAKVLSVPVFTAEIFLAVAEYPYSVCDLAEMDHEGRSQSHLHGIIQYGTRSRSHRQHDQRYRAGILISRSSVKCDFGLAVDGVGALLTSARSESQATRGHRADKATVGVVVQDNEDKARAANSTFATSSMFSLLW